jgi:glutathione synthase/RimK-type ligase-like ATP-grasp enzyme
MKKPIVGILKRSSFSNDPEIRIYKEILDFNGVSNIFLDINQKNFWDDIKSLDVLIYKWGHDHHNHQIATTILPVIENSLGIKCFPDWSTCWHFDDKVKQYYLLKENGFPVVDSFVFWKKDAAIEWLINYNDFPLVFKLRNGAGSMSVRLIKNRKKAKKQITRMFRKGILQTEISPSQLVQILNFDPIKTFRYYAIGFRNRYIYPERRQFWIRHKNYIYFQKFLSGNQWDTRVTTAGNRAHAFRRFNRPNDFRASGSNRWDINPSEIDMRMIKIALGISKKLKFQAMAYDFIYDENKDPKIIEMSYLYGGAGYPDFMNGYWDENLKWHEGRFWPQYFELVDLLEMNELKLPSLDIETSYKGAKII